jgi:CheY-like chemotaxis protein/nitrogen-specific signal transduction histidine kinase
VRSRWEAEALLRQMEQLAEADRRKDQFLALLSHELRNPLAPIMTGLELLRAKFAVPGALIDDATRRTRDVIERQTQHLARLVDDLLDISRISSGKIELRKAPVSIQEIVEFAVSTSQPILSERRHELQVSMPPAPLLVHGDTVRLVQVVANLLNNAARYTLHGGRIWVEAEAKGEQVELRVRDNGRGIGADFISRVFDAFTQEEARAGTGLGLGLSVVRQLVTMHDGTVSVKSDGQGHGSEFTVRLPLDPSAKPVEVAPAPPINGSKPRSLSIVLIDDSEDIRELMADLLRGWGHHVEVACDGESGSELALRSCPDVAFVDIGLPRLDGYGVAEHLRATLSRDRLRLVAMTGFGQESDKRRALEAGFDLHIVKPASIEALKRALAF